MVDQPVEFYKSCNLTMNPFGPNSSDTADVRSGIWVGYEGVKKKLGRMLVSSRSDQIGSTKMGVMYGGFGTGKTHALLWAQNLILHSEKDEFNSVCYYIPTLKKVQKFNFNDTFMYDLLPKSNILEDVKGYFHWLNTQTIKFRDDKNIPGQVDIKTVIKDMFGSSTELYNLAIQIYEAETEINIKKILTPKNDYEAMVLFCGLVNLFTYKFEYSDSEARYKKGAYLFIDEFDDIQSGSPAMQRQVNDLIRHIFDSCSKHLVVICSLSAEISELSFYFEEFNLSRISRYFELQLLETDESVNFIKEILNTARADESLPSDFYPFDEAALELIINSMTQITPRRICNAIHETLERVRLEGFTPSPTNLISPEILDEYEIQDEVLEAIG